jgi:hypothetical protein
MVVYDVSSANDTQRNIHLTDHHSLGAKTKVYIPPKIYLWKKCAACCTAIAHEPVGSATSHDNDARCWRDLTMCVGRTGTCAPDDRAGRHPDQLSLLCPRGDCVTCATNELET